jgi:PAS domain S-box-containing protein
MLDSPSPPPEAEAATDCRSRALRETVVMALAAFLITSAGVFGVWSVTSSTIRQDFLGHLTNLALIAAQQVDPDLHRKLRDPAQLNGPDYQRAVEPLRRMRLALPEVHYIYTMVRGQDGLVHFVLDAADPGDHDGDGVEDQSGVWEVYENVDPTTRMALGDGMNMGRAAATPEPTIDKWGSWMSGMAPLVDGRGEQFGIVGVDVDSSRFLAHLNQARFWSFIGLLPAALLIGALGIAYFRVRMRGLSAELAAARGAHVAHASQQRLAGIIESARVGTWEATVDPDFTGRDILIVDEPWAAMLGRTAGELNPLTPARLCAMLVHPDDVAVTQAAIGEALGEEGRMFSIDARMRHAAGHWLWAEVRGKVIERDAAGRPLRMVGTLMDATARKQAELALQQSEANFRSLFELAPVGICQVEQPSGRFLMVNDSLARSTGYSREELLRMTFWDITPPEWHEAEREEQKSHPQVGGFAMYEKEYRRKDGTRYPVLVSGNHHVDPFGREIGWAIVQDISDRSNVERVLAETGHFRTRR